MANSFLYKDIKPKVGDTISVNYKFHEGDKERTQIFKGVLIQVKGKDNINRTITVRKMSHSGMGIERIFPLASPNVLEIKLLRKGNFQKAKAYFIRNLTESEIRRKLYSKK